MHKLLRKRESKIQTLIPSVEKAPQHRWFGKSTMSLGSHPTFHNHSDFARVIKRTSQMRARRTKSSKTQGWCLLRSEALAGADLSRGQSRAEPRSGSPSSYLYQVFWASDSNWVKRVYFLTWKVFKTPKGFGQTGNIPTPARSFFSGQNKQNVLKTAKN